MCSPLASIGKMRPEHKHFYAVDLFSGCGGLSIGMRKAGFEILAAVEKDPEASQVYRMNYPKTRLFNEDIRGLKASSLKQLLINRPLHFLAGCPPCQGFSSVRKLNKKRSKRDDRNSLILEYLRFVRELRPLALMMENVPSISNYYLFKYLLASLKKLGYYLDNKTVNIADYGVPQRRIRLVLVGSRLAPIQIAPATYVKRTVRDTIGSIEPIAITKDGLHRVVMHHSAYVNKMISRIPRNGGSRLDLPEGYILNCHKNPNIGFRDVYGRMRWDEVAPTITGGCLNPSKGRFLHPEYNRAISAREAALLQSFPRRYSFPTKIKKGVLGSLIGNALPPKFSEIQSKHILNHLRKHDG
jgi:DNA (cytosine-5)-methyltransferase 1